MSLECTNSAATIKLFHCIEQKNETTKTTNGKKHHVGLQLIPYTQAALD